MHFQFLVRGTILVLFAGTAAIPAAMAQAAPERPPAEASGASAAPSPAVVEMSPFEVQTSQDKGYAAQNTTSGSRLNTSLADTPAAISVFTTQFIADIGATDVNDLVQYSVNTDNNLLTGGSQQLSEGGNDPGISIRGIAAGSGAASAAGAQGGLYTNFFQSSVVQDTYNIERAELTRGPNSVLYGVGLPAGGFNVTTKKADVNRSLESASFRFGSYHQARGTIDANQTLIPGKLALRLDAVAEDRNDWHPFAFKKDRRWQLAAGWQIAKNSRLDAEYEGGDRHFSTAPQIGVWDSLTPWIAAGRQLDTLTGKAIPANAALQLNSTGVKMTYDQISGRLDTLTNQSMGDPAGETAGMIAGTGVQQRMISDFSLVPRDVFLGGPAWGNHDVFNRTTVTFSHELFRDFTFEAAYNREANNDVNNDTLSNSSFANVINVDTNAFLPNGAPNPHAGQYYIDAVGAKGFDQSLAQDFRFSGSYGHDFSAQPWYFRWLGQERFLALYQVRDQTDFDGQDREFVVQNPVNTLTPDNANNQLVRRTYLTLNGPIGQIGAANPDTFPVNGLINQSTGLPVSTQYLLSSQPSNIAVKTNTVLLVWQAHLLRDLLVPMFGYREDKVGNWGNPLVVVRGPGYGPFAQGSPLSLRNATADYGFGITRTQGLVVHPFLPWVSLFYNHSSSFALPPNNVKLFPQTFAATTNVAGSSALGATSDYGAKLSLWKDKLFATVTYYQTSANNQSATGGLTTYKTGIGNIWTTLDNAGVLTANGLALDQVIAAPTNAQAHTFDNTSQGWEFELTANPAPNWRLLFNYSTNRTVGSKTALEIRNYYAANQGFWTQGNNGRLVVGGTNGQLAASAIDPNDGLTTIAEALQTQLSALSAQFVAPDGARAIGVPVATANLRTDYAFPQKVLKGFSLGGGARWRGDRVIAYTTSDPATRKPVGSPAELTVDADFSYHTVIARKYRLAVQLNFTNFFANNALIYTTAYADGIPEAFSIPAPRAWFVTTTIGF